MKGISDSELDFLTSNTTFLDISPHLIKRFSKRREEVFAFFDKIPDNQMAQINFPDEKTWNIYNTRLRSYATKYKTHLSIRKLKNEKGYFIFIIKKKEEENEKGLEVKSI